MDYQEVRKIFNYREDGKLIWKETRSNNARKGMVAGFINHGSPVVFLNGRKMLQSKVVFLWHNGHLPQKALYHINGIKSDNRIENLQEGTQSISNHAESFQDMLHKLFRYREDGQLIWIKKKTGAKFNKPAGAMHRNGYKVITIDGKQYPAHRLIWAYHHGYLPECEIDHINREKDDNRIENLRMVSTSCNQRNTGNWSTCTTGVKGVVKGYKGFRAHVRLMNKTFNLGDFDDFDEAVLTRLAAEQCLSWEGCDSSSPAYRYAKDKQLIRRNTKCLEF